MSKKSQKVSEVKPGATPAEGSPEPKVKEVDPIKSVSTGGVAVFRDGMHPRTLRQKSVK